MWLSQLGYTLENLQSAAQILSIQALRSKNCSHSFLSAKMNGWDIMHIEFYSLISRFLSKFFWKNWISVPTRVHIRYSRSEVLDMCKPLCFQTIGMCGMLGGWYQWTRWISCSPYMDWLRSCIFVTTTMYRCYYDRGVWRLWNVIRSLCHCHSLSPDWLWRWHCLV